MSSTTNDVGLAAPLKIVAVATFTIPVALIVTLPLRPLTTEVIE